MGRLHVNFVTMSLLDRESGERQAFKEAAKNAFSWWERFRWH
jgi:hypothetical protein